MWIAILIGIWILKLIMAQAEPSSKEVRSTIAFFSPILALGMAFLWNVWARHIIGWPEIRTIEEFVLLIMIF